MTDIITAMENRHAVRAYDPEKKIPKEITDKLREKIDLLNSESGLHIQLVTDEPKAFVCSAMLLLTYSFFSLPYTLQELLRRQQPLPQSRRQVTMHLFRGFSFRILRELFQTHKLYTHNGLYPALWR